MIAFVTLFLGVVFGVHNVELSATPEVARIELQVDGAGVAALGPPWRATIDLGGEIAPRELVAVAFDRTGTRLGEARQWINRARPHAEAGFVLERDRAGRATTARLFWRCLVSPDPKTISVSFDGRPLAVTDPASIPIPSHAAGSAHILIADLTFAGGIAATAVASFGGRKTDDATQELSAVPVRLAPLARLPEPGQMAGWLESEGRMLSVAAVEEGPAEVVFVMAGQVREDLARLSEKDFWPWPWPRPRPLALASNTRFLFMAGTPQVIYGSRDVTRAFSVSEEYLPADGTFLQLGKAAFLGVVPSFQRIAEAVAVSALAATRRERRRAVVLLLGSGARDASDFDAPRARRYLARLRVPLHVWRVTASAPAASGDWPDAVDASTIDGLAGAFETLRADLSSQRVVWVDGRVLPSAVAVTPEAAGILAVR